MAPVVADSTGVVEVTFTTEDTLAQDALAGRCGLGGGRPAGILPPSVRWYTEPLEVEAAVACVRQHREVLVVVRPG